MTTITGDDIQAMVRHWLETPINGYLGSGYGADANSLLQRAQSEGQADRFVRKLKRDVSVLEVLPNSAVSLYGTPEGVDQLRLTLDVAGRSYDLNDFEAPR
ncbi:hypothetical protein [Halomonas sp. OfavH-34-E]|uniref:hypothetical protein n=1 Tax=Halomonas sp. OfavH-34-E TaxID=2954491 RepID=UPI002097DDEA|nr:hypothetical protein [Halomonas sp. OfavH-34-E]MCO7216001.1 hypothetical protein [Halomonas sp. OfavH-34-E]